MKVIVCTAEKPSVAKDIAKIIGATKAGDGFYEGQSDLLKAYVYVTWTFGHLCELKNPHDYYPEWRHWNFRQLPLIPPKFQIKLKEQGSIQRQFSIIESLYQKADELINCGDAGQEGELIQRWVMQKAKVKVPVKRLWISSLTEDVIKDGIKHLKDQADYDSLYEAGLSRAIADWILGMSATRYYTLYNQNRGTLSVGRVQTPTLALIVERQDEIDNFVPQDYWILATKYRDTVFQATKGRYESEERARADLAEIKKHDFKVANITTKKASESAPRLFDLTSLQVEMNKKYGYAADYTLQVIQALYEKKFTTYPRVDTAYLPTDVYPKCEGILRGLRGYTDYTKKILDKKLPKPKKVFDDSKITDHHAIIPTGNTPYNLSDAEINVFDEIVKRFIAVFYPDCESSNTTVTGKVGKVEFKATGKQILKLGWYEVFGRNPEGKILPAFTKGESGPHQPTLSKKQTTAPSPYTEATLLRAMETAGKSIDDETLRDVMKENGIGRPSTRASIIEILFKRNYITKDKKNLVPTEIGKSLIRMIKNPLLKSAELTGQWEKKLRDIEKRKYSAKQFIDEIKQMTADICRGM